MATDYKRFFTDAMAAGLRFIRLQPEDKLCAPGTWEHNVLTAPEAIQEALACGNNVGFLLQGKGGIRPNPLGIWGLDIDSEEAHCRFSDAPFTVMVNRGHSFKRHYLARLPDTAAPRGSRLIRKSHDVKLTGILVAPGSTHKEGGAYTLFTRKNSSESWEKWNGSSINWAALPVVDPVAYIPAPPELIFATAKSSEKVLALAGKDWTFLPNASMAPWTQMPFVTMKDKPLGARINQGRGYIKNRVRVGVFSRSSEGGRKTLLLICTHLRSYLCLSTDESLKMLTEPLLMNVKRVKNKQKESKQKKGKVEESWNARCVDAKTGQLFPWSKEELIGALGAAEHYVPFFGVLEYRRLEQMKETVARLDAFLEVLARMRPVGVGSPSMSARELWETFLERYSLLPGKCSYRRFSVALNKAIKLGEVDLIPTRRTRKKVRWFKGVDLELIDDAIWDATEEEAG